MSFIFLIYALSKTFTHFCSLFSERADPSSRGDFRQRLTEGANINRSLVTLGYVIKALGKLGWGCFVWFFTVFIPHYLDLDGWVGMGLPLSQCL